MQTTLLPSGLFGGSSGLGRMDEPPSFCERHFQTSAQGHRRQPIYLFCPISLHVRRLFAKPKFSIPPRVPGARESCRSCSGIGSRSTSLFLVRAAVSGCGGWKIGIIRVPQERLRRAQGTAARPAAGTGAGRLQDRPAPSTIAFSRRTLRLKLHVQRCLMQRAAFRRDGAGEDRRSSGDRGRTTKKAFFKP